MLRVLKVGSDGVYILRFGDEGRGVEARRGERMGASRSMRAAGEPGGDGAVRWVVPISESGFMASILFVQNSTDREFQEGRNIVSC